MEEAINPKKIRALKVKRFFFPFAPIKTTRSLRLLILIAALIALKIILTFVSVNIVPFSLSLSIAWVPVIILGWYFGPVAGLFLGMLTDTISYFIKGGAWFWMYAIQEPIVALISGLIAGFYRWRRDKTNKKIATDIIISQVFTLGFVVFVYVILLVWLKPNAHFSGYKPEHIAFYNVYKWVAFALLLAFVVAYEVLTILNYKNKLKIKDKNSLITYIYTSTCVIVIALLFSFALGPYTAVKYLTFLNGTEPTSYLKYGSIFYLIPRVAIEAIKTPIELAVVYGGVTILDKSLMNTINKINASYQD